MEHPLEDSHLKIARAWELFADLHKELPAWSRDHPIKADLGFNERTGDLMARIPQAPTLPGRWSVILGEIGHNLRSALDYVVFQLAEHEKGARTAFPIGESKNQYSKKHGKRPSYRDKCLRGVPKQWAWWIDQLQPFMNPTPKHLARELSVLNGLWNGDKHRSRVICLIKLELPFGWVTFDPSVITEVNLRVSPSGRVLWQNEFMAPNHKGRVHFVDFLPKKNPNGTTGNLQIVFPTSSHPGTRKISATEIGTFIMFVEFVVGSFHPAFD